MLRHVRISNFVHFEEEQRVDFQRGSHFFIGPNNSGKTSVFEAIRRCLSMAMNTSVSSSHDPTKEAVVICIYDKVHHTIDGPEVQDMSVHYDARYTALEGKLLTSIVCLSKNSPDDVSVYLKFAIYFGKGVRKVGMDFLKENSCKFLVNERIKFLFNDKGFEQLTEMLETFLMEMFKPKEQQKNTDYFVEKFVKHIFCDSVQILSKEFAIKDIREDKESPCNKILRDYLDEHVVFTFPLRSIGSLQWSFSERISVAYRDEKYQNAQKCAEIITWYIKRCKETEGNNGVEHEKEKLYFDRITNNSGFEFTQEDGARLKVTRKSCTKDPEKIPLIKVPEGILEAKSCSILLAADCFTTVGLEDPERGMHPQMVERLRDLVLWEIENKVVLVTSHHPSFLAPWAISRICFFRYNEHQNTFRIISGERITESLSSEAKRKSISDTKENTESASVESKIEIVYDRKGKIEPLFDESKLSDTKEKTEEIKKAKQREATAIQHTLRIITDYHFSSLFFAERILFVEGETDYLFMSTVRRLLMKHDYYLLEQMNTDQLETFRRFMASLQIMHLCGEGNKEKINNLCKNLEIERYILLDNDAIKLKDGETTTFVQKFDLEYEQEAIENDVHLLENVGIFVWEQKNIEEVLIVFSNNHAKTHTNECPQHTDMRQCLVENNVPIDEAVNDRIEIAKKRKKWKLFKDKTTPNEAIGNLIDTVLVISGVEQKSEFRRLVDFLCRMAKERDTMADRL